MARTSSSRLSPAYLHVPDAQDADEIVADFVYYAEICFKRYGDRIKHWSVSFPSPSDLAPEPQDHHQRTSHHYRCR